jgi:hypothetical protein
VIPESRNDGDTSIVRQELAKDVPTATDTHSTINEILETVFSTLFLSKLYNKDHS